MLEDLCGEVGGGTWVDAPKVVSSWEVDLGAARSGLSDVAGGRRTGTSISATVGATVVSAQQRGLSFKTILAPSRANSRSLRGY